MPDDAGDRAVAGRDLEPLADEDRRVPAADGGEPEEAVVVDVVDDQPDLVDVADDREHRPAAGAGHARDGRADGVVGDLGELGAGVAEHRGGRLLVAGGAGRRQQPAQDVGDAHSESAVSWRRTYGRMPPCRK